MGARLLLVAALCLASVKAAVIPAEEIVDNLQSFLTAPEKSGLRLKRSTGEWDKEFDLSSMGILFQLKYNNPANPFEGGRAHVKVPGARFIRNAPFDDMDLDIEFNGGSAIDGLFDMKVDYKFIQKFMFLADRPQERSFVLYRKMEGGMWKTKVTVDNNNMMPKPFLDISVESDRKTKLHVLFNFEEDNKWELKVDRIPGQSITIEATINGQKWTMQKDFKQGEVSIKYKNQNYGVVQLKGDSHMEGMIPAMFDYVVKYNLPILELYINSGRTAQEYQGKAKLKVDARAPTKKIEISFAPKTGKPFEYNFDFNLSSGFKYDSDLKVNGKTVEKVVGEYTWTNDADKFELESTENYSQTKENPFYELSKWMCGGHEFMAGVQTRKIFFEKGNKHHFLGKKILFEEKTIFDEKTWYHVRIYNEGRKSGFLFTYLPYNMDHAWTYEGGREHMRPGTYMNTVLTHKITHGENVIQEGTMVFDVKANDGSKFEMEHVHKIMMTEESPVYGPSHWYTGRYGKNVERKMTVFFDKINKSF